jgi:predicted membrane protein
MDDLGRRKRPGVAFAGFLVPFALLLALVFGYQAGSFADFGWRGGQYAYAFIGVAFGAILVGCLLKLVRPPWNSFGTELILGGTLGVVSAIAIIVLILVALSRWTS